ncbi:MAG: 23S rRNA (cytidine(2498)-2'-O)-methyltransferase RlmM [Pseudobdellovibrionaceae bacterium]|nr:23S rRNA (cytidine(2498)-2'-O)-methyltransferase RlmM [Pseudobdellovibrionaceae bacterium]
MRSFLLYCRAGFEKDCAAEAHDRFAEKGWNGYPQITEGNGLVIFNAEPFDPTDRTIHPPSGQDFVFARQMVEDAQLVKGLADGDRATPLVQALLPLAPKGVYRELRLEYLESQEGLGIAPFYKKFSPALFNALKRQGLKHDRNDARAPILHIMMPSYEEAWVGRSLPSRTSPWVNGIPRLKFPKDAPSRSTLKLDEAFLTLLDDEGRTKFLESPGTAVDLGAAPGGWTFQMVQRGYFVTAVDNADMDSALMNTGLVDHKTQDAFKFRPKHAVDLLLCDMVDRPQKVVPLIASWFKDKLCRWAVFNLKLPMKKRFEEYETCLQQFWELSGLNPENYVLRARQLYHDREEITILVRPKIRTRG